MNGTIVPAPFAGRVTSLTKGGRRGKAQRVQLTGALGLLFPLPAFQSYYRYRRRRMRSRFPWMSNHMSAWKPGTLAKRAPFHRELPRSLRAKPLSDGINYTCQWHRRDNTAPAAVNPSAGYHRQDSCWRKFANYHPNILPQRLPVRNAPLFWLRLSFFQR